MYTHARSKYIAVAIATAQTPLIALRLIPSAKKMKQAIPVANIRKMNTPIIRFLLNAFLSFGESLYADR